MRKDVSRLRRIVETLNWQSEFFTTNRAACR